MTLQDKIREYREYQRMKEELEAQLDALRLDIITDMGDADEMTAGDYKVRYKPVTSSRLDTTALKKDLPDIAARFMLTSTTHRFSVA
jgi:predicted phage-related endonuclease